ncbi:MAG: hypothetical protein O7B26_02910 [Planctomycetota bacterium]|nr:hypothetical protein [Planctomycetota bacterium]
MTVLKCPARRIPRYTWHHCLAVAVVVWAALSVSVAWAEDENPATEPRIEAPPESTVTLVGENRFTLHLVDVPLTEALRLLAEPTKRNIVLARDAGGTVNASMYEVDFNQALTAMLTSNGLGYRLDGSIIYVHTLEDLALRAAAQRRIGSRVFTLNYITATVAKNLIEPFLSPDVGKLSSTPPASVGLGGRTGMPDTEGDSDAGPDRIIVTDYEDRLDEYAVLIKALDVRPKQVLIEATILRASLNEQNALGIDFTTVGGIDFAALSSTSPAAQSITTGNTPTNQLSETTFTVRTDLAGSVPNGGFTFGIIKDQIGVFIRALEEITDTEIIANPKILTLNKQVGEVIVGRRDGYITTTFTETQAIQTIEFLETGTVLSFRPFIGDDGMIRMEVHPKDSTGGLTQANLPFEQTTEVTTNIMVRDGHTILIGGLFRDVTTATRGQVPGLGNLPLAGVLFRSTSDNTVREEVIILLTVHIVKDGGDYAASDELNEDIERHRAGMRHGLQWLGRERLAQAHYRWAVSHFDRGEVDRALWDARMAIRNSPRHLPAIKLIEKITRNREWDSEASAIRNYVRARIAEENGVEFRPFGRPVPRMPPADSLDGSFGFDAEDHDASDPDQTEWRRDATSRGSARP